MLTLINDEVNVLQSNTICVNVIFLEKKNIKKSEFHIIISRHEEFYYRNISNVSISLSGYKYQEVIMRRMGPGCCDLWPLTLTLMTFDLDLDDLWPWWPGYDVTHHVMDHVMDDVMVKWPLIRGQVISLSSWPGQDHWLIDWWVKCPLMNGQNHWLIGQVVFDQWSSDLPVLRARSRSLIDWSSDLSWSVKWSLIRGQVISLSSGPGQDHWLIGHQGKRERERERAKKNMPALCDRHNYQWITKKKGIVTLLHNHLSVWNWREVFSLVPAKYFASSSYINRFDLVSYCDFRRESAKFEKKEGTFSRLCVGGLFWIWHKPFHWLLRYWRKKKICVGGLFEIGANSFIGSRPILCIFIIHKPV